MEKRVKLRDQLLKIVLGIALLIGIYFSFQQTFPPILNNSGRAVQELYIWVSIISMFAGFVNIYMTTKRDVKFIYPDLVNLITTIIALFLAQTYSMLPMSFWGLLLRLSSIMTGKITIPMMDKPSLKELINKQL